RREHPCLWKDIRSDNRLSGSVVFVPGKADEGGEDESNRPAGSPDVPGEIPATQRSARQRDALARGRYFQQLPPMTAGHFLARNPKRICDDSDSQTGSKLRALRSNVY